MIRKSNLTGAQIPNLRDRLKVLLFADDTTVFLTKQDKYSTLTEILNLWCKAARAKFNIMKTEIIPIGSQNFRDIFVQSRKLNNTDDPIPTNIHIAQQGEETRILGAWIGNGARETTKWRKISNDIEMRLARWDKGNPGIEGRRHVVQMMVGGCSQYLTSAHGMPREVRSDLECYDLKANAQVAAKAKT
ncbi:hypothetical protein AGABI2DRAFT_79877 [Agaricus bisporus var. bisporus H97]|uniref:hypothetical protein n=1 Tax=Agaricus bisporus var. bisporus (strain H97 / ATCC MYA-4626 / FGSC 10389) TaxID=936046 RepID=UPI00029F5F9A|nr:hypothetical protein AGABI2DRAFT_79877 [Agaricus bisporus var. bisporus H97]EKV41869.1 hypothetical protein AGABI2DRAFT_79877 [Agaricus bisporus var. bisporus H97]